MTEQDAAPVPVARMVVELPDQLGVSEASVEDATVELNEVVVVLTAVVVTTDDVEEEEDEVVDVGRGVSEIRLPVTPYEAAQSVRDWPSGQQMVSPSDAAAQ